MVKRPLACTCLAFSLVLFFLIRLRPAPYTDYSRFEGREITAEGMVYRKEKVRQADGVVTVLYLKLSSPGGRERDEDRPQGKKVICYLKTGQSEPEMGSRIRITGKLKAFQRAVNPGQFDAYSYYQVSGISYRLNQAVISAKSKQYNRLTQSAYEIRSFLADKLAERLPEKEAALMQTMLLGEKRGMDRELKSLYQRNGIAHVLAISGLHVSMLGMGLYRLLRKWGVPMTAAAITATGFMFFYGVMTGFSVSVVRAVLMFAIQMLGVLLKRSYDMLTALGVAAVLLLIEQPLYLYHSGFIFSFGCLLGIGVVLPALVPAHKKNGDKLPSIGKTFLSGAAMSVITVPLYLWFYYQFPVYSVFLNMLVIPLMSLLMAAGLLLLASCVLCPPVSMPFVLLIQGILNVYEKACGICDRLPGNLLTPGKPEGWQMLLFLFLLTLAVAVKKKSGVGVRWGMVVAALLVLLIPSRGGLKITFLDVGQGDCICIENGRGKNYLIDGGSSTVSGVGEYRIIPFLKSQGISELEAVFVTHPDQDHCNGIRELMEAGALQGIKVKHFLLPDVSHDVKNEVYLELEQRAREKGIRVSYISRGQRLEDGKLTLRCLHPETGDRSREANEYSTVLKLTYGNFSAMLTGDVEGMGEQKLIQFLEREGEERKLTVLKAAHHGSAYSTSVELLELLTPYYTVISCGERNSYGHPHQELLERLAEQETNILITYETGAVTFETNGKKVKIRRFLK